MQRVYNGLKQEGAELVALSVDNLTDAESAARTLGLEYPVLADADAAVTKSWGLFNRLGDNVSAPATFVFDATGQLRGFRIGRDAGDRPHASEILDLVRSFGREGTVAAPGQTAGTPVNLAGGNMSCEVPGEGTPVADCNAPPTRVAPQPTSSPSVMLGTGLIDFTLPNANGGGQVTLSQYLGEKNVVLVFYRAWR